VDAQGKGNLHILATEGIDEGVDAAYSRSDSFEQPVAISDWTSAGQIVTGTAFDPEKIADCYWEVVHSDGPWQAEFRYTGE
jgi:hypothetical protein